MRKSTINHTYQSVWTVQGVSASVTRSGTLSMIHLLRLSAAQRGAALNAPPTDEALAQIIASNASDMATLATNRLNAPLKAGERLGQDEAHFRQSPDLGLY